MRLRAICIFLPALFFVCNTALAQNTPAQNDSAKFYRDIEHFSNKSKVIRFLHRLFFKPVDIPAEQKARTESKNLQSAYKDLEGKIIRNIRITSLDPFGYVAADTSKQIRNFLYDIGNKAHIKTQRLTIKNLLLINKNDPFDSLRIKESERLIRSQSYVQEVLFYFESKKNSDSVDVIIRVIDKWSLIPRADISTSSFTISLKEINFLGLGHEFNNVFTRNYDVSHNAFSTNYFIPNIKNTYINTNFFYGINKTKVLQEVYR